MSSLKQKKLRLKQLILLSLVLQLADVGTTYVTLNLPNTEIKEFNPLIRPLTNNGRWDLIVATKLAFVVGMGFKLNKELNKNPNSNRPLKSLYISNGMMSAVVANNLVQITRFLIKSKKN